MESTVEFSSIPILIKLLKPYVNYSWRTAQLTNKETFYIFIQKI